MASGKKSHLQVFDIIDLAKTKIMDPTVFAATFLPRRIWKRAFGPARFIFAAFSRRAASSRASRSPLFPGTYARRCFLVPLLLPWTTGRHRSPRFVSTVARRRKFLLRQSTGRTIYDTKSLPRAGVAGGVPDWCLPSGPRPCIYVKFPPSIVKLPKLQNTNAKLLDTLF